MEHAHRRSLFIASCISLTVTGFSFSIRPEIFGELEAQFGWNSEQLGWLNGPGFWGFTLAMIFGGPFCDWLGMKKLIGLAFLGHLAGTLVSIFAGPIANATGGNPFTVLYSGYLLLGVGCGLIEAACNPLIATMYGDEKTKMLNRFHAWFPAGLVVGGLAAYGINKLSAGGMEWLNWQWKLGIMIIPTLIYGAMFLPHKLPVTERVATGVSTSRMFTACLSPLFIVMLIAMLLTAATELGPNTWIPDILNFTASIPGILVLVWISGLMFVGRQFAGPVVHKLSPIGVLLGAAVFSAIGLFLLSKATNAPTAFGAATVFAIGVCYFWPTMLGFISERMPQTGALGLSIFGGAGMLSAAFILPIMGSVYDDNTETAIPETYKQQVLAAAPESPPVSDEDPVPPEIQEAIDSWNLAQTSPDTYVRNTLARASSDPESAEATMWLEAKAEGGAATLGVVSVLPIGLLVIFGGVFAFDRRSRGKGGHIVDSGTDPA
ncbi:MAG: MFS family permease [Phycisphaerales bacterium]|jgi:MFS family permease